MGLTIKYRCLLQEKRVRAGLTQVQLAKMLGVSWQTIAAYEQNRVKPNVVMLSRIAAILDCSWQELVDVQREKEVKHA